MNRKSAAVFIGITTLLTTLFFSCRKAPTPIVSICAAGDIFAGRGVEEALRSKGYDFSWPFEEAAPLLKAADIAFGNLEGPIGLDREVGFSSTPGSTDTGDTSAGTNTERITLENPPGVLEGLSIAGFDVLNVANNHSFDRGRIGLSETLRALEKAGIKYTGVSTELRASGNAEVIKVKNTRVGFLGYSWTPPELEDERCTGIEKEDPERMREHIRNLKPQVDYVIVSLHWGREDSSLVSYTQRTIAHYLIDSGADVIIGHHPHRMQAVERYKGKPIAYSLGNFLFDQPELPNREGFILDLRFSKQGIETELIPYRIEKRSRIHMLSENEAEALFSMMQELCSNVDARTYRDGNRLIVR